MHQKRARHRHNERGHALVVVADRKRRALGPCSAARAANATTREKYASEAPMAPAPQTTTRTTLPPLYDDAFGRETVKCESGYRAIRTSKPHDELPRTGSCSMDEARDHAKARDGLSITRPAGIPDGTTDGPPPDRSVPCGVDRRRSAPPFSQAMHLHFGVSCPDAMAQPARDGGSRVRSAC
jgi:hypothetical protein